MKIYNHIDDQHPDSLRFLHDCEEWFYKEIEIIQHTYKTVDQACKGANYLIGVAGPACSRLLKRRLFPNFMLRDLEKYRGNLEIVVPDFGSFCEIP